MRLADTLPLNCVFYGSSLHYLSFNLLSFGCLLDQRLIELLAERLIGQGRLQQHCPPFFIVTVLVESKLNLVFDAFIQGCYLEVPIVDHLLHPIVKMSLDALLQLCIEQVDQLPHFSITYQSLVD